MSASTRQVWTWCTFFYVVGGVTGWEARPFKSRVVIPDVQPAAPVVVNKPVDPQITAEDLRRFADWNHRDASDLNIDERMRKHDEAARDMERLMNSGF